MSSFEAAITGIGLVTPVGVGVDVNWTRILSGDSAARRDPTLSGLPVEASCRVPDFSGEAFQIPNAWQWDRFGQFALVAAWEALCDAGLEPKRWADEARVAVIIGSGAGGTSTLETQHALLLSGAADELSSLTLPMGLLNMAAGQVATMLGARGPCFAPCSACASGATAIGLGRELLRSGIVDVVVAGGTEAPITPLYVSAFAQMRALSRNPRPDNASRPFDAQRDGFVIGEGAGILVMESDEHARERGARVRGRLIGYGASADAHHPTSPHPAGLGAKLAMLAALKDAGIGPSDVGFVNAHGTSTRGNDVVEAGAIRDVFGSRVQVSSTKGVTGHLLGAAGAIEAAYTVLSLSDGLVPPTANLRNPDPKIDVDLVYGAPRPTTATVGLSNSFGFGGQNASLVIAT